MTPRRDKVSAFLLTWNFDRWMQALLLVALIMTLVPVWLNTCFMTGDGPSHVYNAQVLLDMISSQHLSFYERFYLINPHTDPNWFGHLLLAALLTVFKVCVAEKVFVSAYIIGYVISLKVLLNTINPGNSFLVFMGLPFIFFHTLQAGFYNYSWSFIFLFVVIALMIRQIKKYSHVRMLLLMLGSTLLYFTHPIGWFLAILTCGFLVAFQYFIPDKSLHESRHKPHIVAAGFIVPFIPGLILMVEYLSRKGIDPSPNPDSLNSLLLGFIELRGLITMTSMEVAWALWVAILYGLVLIYGLWRRFRQPRIDYRDALFIVFLATFVIYIIQPGGMAGAGVGSVRLQLIPYLIILLWFGAIEFQIRYKWIIIISAFCLNGILIYTRYPHHAFASDAVEEILTAGDSIHSHSVVLPLSFSHNGRTPDGHPIATRSWLFMHAADYLGAEKPLIMLGNYEANTGYFPIVWKDDINPFRHLSIDPGIEHQPPCVDITQYQRSTGVEIDYVLTWGFREQDKMHPCTKYLLSEIAQNYTLSFVSQHARVRLYRRNESF